MPKKPTLKELDMVLAGMLSGTCESFIVASRGTADYAKVASIVAENAGKMVGSLCYSNVPMLAEEKDASVATVVTTFEKAARSMEEEVAQVTSNLADRLSKMASDLKDGGQTPSEDVVSAVADLLKRSQ